MPLHGHSRGLHARHASKPSHGKVAGTSVEFIDSETAKIVESVGSRACNLWIHDDAFSKEETLVNPDILGDGVLRPGDLVEIASLKSQPETHDFLHRHEAPAKASRLPHTLNDSAVGDSDSARLKSSRHEGKHGAKTSATDFGDANAATRYMFVVKSMPEVIRNQHPGLQISVTSAIANTFGFRDRSQVTVSIRNRAECAATHVEIRFRDEYLARSDMWRLIISELAGKTIYKGQRIQFLGSVRATIKTIYINGEKVTSAYFSSSTIPIFRSESARYVLFIQMSKEMWDFDSEGSGEILFSRVIDGFLPELFKRWADLEAKHLVSIVMFGRLEYDRSDVDTGHLNAEEIQSLTRTNSSLPFQDFYRVVVSDMSSGQWRVILDELKKEFRVFLRDISLESTDPDSHPQAHQGVSNAEVAAKIRGRPSSALRGNILEAINIASRHYASDYLDRDLVRTGISVVVITAGTGIFEVDRNLLELTSESLANNGMGIDLVCLSKMPLHSVPLFKYSPSLQTENTATDRFHNALKPYPSLPPMGSSLSSQRLGVSPVLATIYGSAPRSLKRSSAIFEPHDWCYGIPQWIDVSYWAPDSNTEDSKISSNDIPEQRVNSVSKPHKIFIPRVRMYELQMMGVMELGLANISIPYLSEGLPSRLALRTNSVVRNAIGTGTDIGTNGPPSASNSLRSLAGSFGKRESPIKSRKRGILSGQARKFRSTFDRMDEYDGNVYIVEKTKEQKTGPVGSGMKNGQRRSSALKVKVSPPKRISSRLQHGNETPRRDKATTEDNNVSVTPKQRNSSAQRPPLSARVSSSRISRSISFALRGLGTAPPRATASTEVNIAHAKAETPVKSSTSRQPLAQATGSLAIPDDPVKSTTRHGIDSERDDNSDSATSVINAGQSPSRPISIQKPGPRLRQPEKGDVSETDHSFSTVVTTIREEKLGQETYTATAEQSNISGSESSHRIRSKNTPPQIAWVKNVNPSNPARNDPNLPASFGRWQHVFPKAPRTSVVKWRSLCTPAAVPLTTEEFPSPAELENEYVETPYSVWQYDEREMQETPNTREHLLREMVSLRMSHGYQIVLGSETTNPGEFWPSNTPDIYDTSKLSEGGTTVFMSMGNTIQRLQCVGPSEIQVTRYVKKSLAAHRAADRSVPYAPKVRTILSEAYLNRKMTIAGFTREYPWNQADLHLAGHTNHHGTIAEKLRFWRARFVLIPIEAPTTARRFMPTAMTQDNEEEIHILGIQQLAQTWQRLRFVPPEERRFQPIHNKKKDPNPLDIIFRTVDPSRVVAGEKDDRDHNQLTEEANKSTQLLPESELFTRNNLNLANLVQTMQGDKGIDIANRWWHWRLHSSCFIGVDMTTWLLQNFRDIETRSEATKFGNELMEQGVFQHVDKRHEFRDGMYLYQFGPNHGSSRPESRRSWFPGRRSDASVPSTPAAETPMKSSPLRSRSRSGSDFQQDVDQSETSTPTKQSKNRMSICLSKRMRLDVDVRKRSNRPEIVELHYDRVHNPENCYHLEIAWFNVISKLVEDAVVSWATTAEKYGLRLVEVPIAEASSYAAYGPFRTPSIIRLRSQPPATQQASASAPSLPYFNASSFPGYAVEVKHYYQKALLKQFDFVLDLEAASEFPADVDVTYSWGNLNYQHTQFIHKSGVLLAQITDDGNFLLLANRLYNTRSAAGKDAVKFEANHSRAANSRRPAQRMPSASVTATHPTTPGVVNGSSQTLASQGGGHASPHLSPLVRATSDVFGSHAWSASDLKTYISPGQIKDDLEAFCSDSGKLEAFYAKIANTSSGEATPKKISSSSSAIQPVRNVENLPEIPEIRLPASIVGSGLDDRPRTAATLRGKDSPKSHISKEGRRDKGERHSSTAPNSNTPSRKASGEEKHIVEG